MLDETQVGGREDREGGAPTDVAVEQPVAELVVRALPMRVHLGHEQGDAEN